jgi:hypothetical protein
MTSRTRSAGNVTEGFGGIEWQIATDAIGADNVPAQAALQTGEESTVLSFTEFGFTIPADATLEGISVALRCSAQPVAAGELWTVFLLLDEVQLGSKSAEPATSTLEDQVFGGVDDLWSATLTASDINSVTFGCQVKAGIVDLVGGAVFSIDDVRMTITYSGGTEQVRRPGSAGIGVGVGV